MTGGRGRIVHFGFEIGNGFVRFLCCAKVGHERLRPKLSDKKKVTCQVCKKRYEIIQRQIKKLGVEWVCEGIWLPLEQRTYHDVCAVGQ